jgi:hypothetical protein
MQRVRVVRYTTKPGHTAENEALSRAVFAQLRSAPPERAVYALFRDGNEFIHVFLNLKAAESARVTDLAAFKAFEKGGIACALRNTATGDATGRKSGGLFRLLSDSCVRIDIRRQKILLDQLVMRISVPGIDEMPGSS